MGDGMGDEMGDETSDEMGCGRRGDGYEPARGKELGDDGMALEVRSELGQLGGEQFSEDRLRSGATARQ
jgi:hypothetical protein